jgi:hypothetical protein
MTISEADGTTLRVNDVIVIPANDHDDVAAGVAAPA